MFGVLVNLLHQLDNQDRKLKFFISVANLLSLVVFKQEYFLVITIYYASDRFHKFLPRDQASSYFVLVVYWKAQILLSKQ